MRVNIGDVWKEALTQVQIGGAWRSVAETWVQIGDVWKSVGGTLPPPPTSDYDLTGFKITIDPGHSRYVNQGVSGLYWESRGNLEFSLKLRTALMAYGASVEMTRTIHDIDVSLYERAAIANAYKSELFLSIHSNASSTASTRGVYCIRSINLPDNQDLGNLMAYAIMDAMPVPLRRYTTSVASTTRPGFDYYTVIDRTVNFPITYGWSHPYSFIIERAYHTNTTDEALLRDLDVSLTTAEALATAIAKYFTV